MRMRKFADEVIEICVCWKQIDVYDLSSCRPFRVFGASACLIECEKENNMTYHRELDQ